VDPAGIRPATPKEAVKPSPPATADETLPIPQTGLLETGIVRALSSHAIAGVVRNEPGEPVVGANVAAYDADTGETRATADADGRFVLESLDPAKTYRVSAVAPGHGEFVFEQVVPGTHNLEIVLPPSSTVRGRVVDAETNAPISAFGVSYLPAVPSTDAEWAVESINRNVAWRSVRNAGGEFEIADIRANEPVAIAVRAQGYKLELVRLAPITPGKSSTDVIVSLAAGATISGTVVTPEDAPASFARVSAGTSEQALVEAATTDGEGRFTIHSAPEVPLILVADFPGYDSARANVTPVAGTTTEVRLVLAAGGAVEGVVTTGGVAASRQRVVASLQARPSQNPKSNETTTDADGRYEITGLPAGQYDVMAYFKDDSASDAERMLTQPAVVEAGATTAVDFSFQAATAAVAGRVTIDGVPTADVDIQGVIGAGATQTFFSAVVGTDGAFRAERLPAGAVYLEVTVHIDADSDVKRVFTFALGEGQEVWQEVAISSETAIFGIVQGLGVGEAAEVLVAPGTVAVNTRNVEEMLALREMASSVVSTGNGGVFRVQGIDPGAYTVIAISFNPDDDAGDPMASLRIASELVSLEEGEQRELTLALK